ncbi:MAG: amidohydrolase family protein [Deltaproteobacteria bacterium]|nr:amidohydrolase family protein [Deltaproteobacteria bacterium]
MHPGCVVGGGNVTVFPTEFSARTGPLVDAHSHLLDPEIYGVSAEEMLSRMWQAGVSGVTLFGPTTDLRQLQQAFPDYVIPFVQVRRDPLTKQLLLNENTVPSLEQALRTGAFRGIGELSLRHREFMFSPPGGDQNPADGPIPLQIYDLAARYGVPVNIHVEHEFMQEVERALQQKPNTTFIWAHMGDAQAGDVLGLMRTYPNLYADISTRNPFFRRPPPVDQASINLTYEDGTLKEEWRALFEEFPDRFLFGIDLGTKGLGVVEPVMEYYRSVLAQLSPAAAEKIANGNLRRLLRLP